MRGRNPISAESLLQSAFLSRSALPLVRVLGWMAVFLMMATPEHAQMGIPPSSLSFQHWGREQGLPDDAVTALLQTQDGYLWVGTDAGLARFDGVRFDSAVLARTATNSPVAITCLAEDSSRRLWIGTQNDGLIWLADGVAHRFEDGQESFGLTINSIAVDRNGHLWVGATSGLHAVDLSTLRPVAPPPGLANQYITSVHAAWSGVVWITTRNGMWQFKEGRITPVEFHTEELGRRPEFIGSYEDRSGNLWAFGNTYLVNLSERKRFNYFSGRDSSSLRIWTLCEGRRGRLWIGTTGQGLFSFSEGKFRPMVLRDGHLPSDVRAICEDRQGNLWLGTFGGGLIRLRVRREQVLGAASGLPDEMASCIAVDGKGRLWTGFEHGGLFAEASHRFERRAGQRFIRSVAARNDGSVWFGTQGEGLLCLKSGRLIRFGTADGLSSDSVTAVAVDSNGAVWAGTSAGTVHRLTGDRWESFRASSGLSHAPIFALLPAAAGRVWAGSAAGEVLRLENGKFQLQPAASRLAGCPIRALAEDHQGRLWIGTAGKGLACLIGGGIDIWDQNRGFPDNDILSVLVDTNGAVWTATPKGIFRLDTASGDGHFKTAPFSRPIFQAGASARDSLAPGFPAALRTPEGQLCFSMPGGLVVVNPREVENRPAPMPVRIEEVLANGAPLRVARGTSLPVRLPANLASLEIRFTALELGEPERVRFQHKLDGFDADWLDSGGERRARYGRLPYGRFTFHLRARAGDGRWSESEPQLVLLHPAPAWRSPEAIAGASLGAVGLVALVVRGVSHRRLRFKLARMARQQGMEKERMRIAQNMHDEIGSKLTKISYLSELALGNGEGVATESVRSIATTSRDLLQALDEMVWAVNPHNDSLEHLAVYLAHYATEYFQNTAMELELEIPGDLPLYPVSAEIRHNLFVAFEEALGNVLKHSGAPKVQVQMRVADDALFSVIVSDSGKGFDAGGPVVPSARLGIGGKGLDNMRQRLSAVGGECNINSAPTKGTTVTLTIRLAPSAD